MDRISPEALGQTIRTLRERHEPAMSQEELGSKARYKAGAGVSISRVENGRTRPGPARLALIAEALGVTAEEVEARAMERTKELEQEAVGADVPLVAQEASGWPTSGRSTKQRLEQAQLLLGERIAAVQQAGDAFNTAHDRARDEFLMPFVELAEQVTGAPEPPDAGSLSEESFPPEASGPVAKDHLDRTAYGVVKALAAGVDWGAVGAGVGRAAAYAAFSRAALSGTESSGRSLAGLAPVLASNPTVGFLGARAIALAGGTTLLAGMVAGPAALLAVGGLAWMSRRNRAQDAELAARLDEVEAEIASTQAGYDALIEVLARAALLLEYVATHAGHACRRWGAGLPPMPSTWSDMTSGQQQSYLDFTTIAGSQLSVANLHYEELLATHGQQQEHLFKVAREVLTQAKATVESLV